MPSDSNKASKPEKYFVTSVHIAERERESCGLNDHDPGLKPVDWYTDGSKMDEQVGTIG